MPKLFIIFYLLSRFSNALDKLKLVKYVSLVFTRSFYINFGNKSSIHDSCEQKQLQGNGMTRYY